MHRCAIALLFFPVATAAAQQPRTVSGRILDAADSSAVVQVMVELLGTNRRAVTDSAGAFTLVLTRTGAFRLLVRGVGIRPDTVRFATPPDTSVTVYVTRAPVPLAPVEVVGARSDARDRFDEHAQPSTVTLGGEDIKRLPAVLEPDVLRAIQLLPGTVAKNDYTIGYNVRGGESDQNLIQLDGVPMFNPSHLAGLFSTFDADAIEHTDFLTGGFPAGYSGRLSSVLDITLRDGNHAKLHGSSQISALSSKLLLDGPLPGSWTFLVSGRRTYLDAMVSAFTREILPYHFSDLLGKISHPVGQDGFVALTGYWGGDALDMSLVPASESRNPVNLAFNWGNRVLGLRSRIPVGPMHVEARAAYSDFSTTLGLLPDLARFDNTIRLETAGLTLQTGTTPRQHLQLGGSLEHYTMTYDVVSPAFETTLLRTRYRPTVWSAFVDEEWAPSKRLMLRPGIRVEDVPDANFVGVSPRVALKVFLTPAFALTGSAGRYYQAIHSIRDQELPITIFEFWIGADQNVPVASSDHLVFGFEAWKGAALQLTVEGYRKTFTNLVFPNQGNDLVVQGDEFTTATGDAWGFDVLLRRHVGRVRGWIAYGFSRTTRTVGGETYPPAHDRRHTLNIVLQAPGPWGSDFGARWGFGSPLPYTAFTGEWSHAIYNATDGWFERPDREPIAGPINGARFPVYSRLDLGWRWSFSKFHARWEPYLYLVNLYNRRNVFMYFFDYGAAPPTRTGISQLPLLPTLGMAVRF